MPILLKLPDLRTLGAPWQIAPSQSASPAAAMTTPTISLANASPETSSPEADNAAAVAAAVAAAPLVASVTPAAEPNMIPVVAVESRPVEIAPVEIAPVESARKRPTAATAAHEPLEVRQPTTPAAVTADIEPGSLVRERRRRREDDLPPEAQSMTKQWATVLILVAVISTSFYLLNRPRTSRDPSDGGLPGTLLKDEVARTQKGPQSPQEPGEYIEESVDSGDSELNEDPIPEPTVPPTLQKESRRSPAAEAPSESVTVPLEGPADDLGNTSTNRYPSTDPSRYEFRLEGARNAERYPSPRSR